jgi:hypothetical protein
VAKIDTLSGDFSSAAWTITTTGVSAHTISPYRVQMFADGGAGNIESTAAYDLVASSLTWK